MLGLINAERVNAGVDPVVLGDNVAAQLHAEDALENCFSSHWGLNGLKPYMRYSLAGGYQSNGENVSGLSYCLTSSSGYRELGPVEQEIREHMDSLMSSPGHRDNILKPWHRKVNIGLAWDSHNLMVVQHFEGDHVEYAVVPVIEDGVLTLLGMVKGGLPSFEVRDLSVGIFYDPPPQLLTRGQVARTYAYCYGQPVAWLRQEAPAGSFYTNDTFLYSYYYPGCRDPYKVPPDKPAPMAQISAEIARIHPGEPPQLVTLPWIDASMQMVPGDSFSVDADLRGVLAKHGPGVYSLIIWGKISGEEVIISEYSIFHGITPPEGYTSEGLPTKAAPIPTPMSNEHQECGRAGADPSNIGLMADCLALLAAKDFLADTGSFNWRSAA